MAHSPELDRLAAQLARDPASPVFAALAEGLRKVNEIDAALAIAHDGVAANPDYLPGHLVLARIAAVRSDWRGARAALDAALRLDPAHPVALAAMARLPSVAATGPAAFERDVDGDDDEPLDDVIEAPVPTESLAMLYRGQGHLDEALAVLDRLVAREPGNRELQARRDAVLAEAHASRPRPFDAARTGGPSVREWLATIAAAHAPPSPAGSSYDAFYNAPPTPPVHDGDLGAFQAWLRELDR